MKHTSLLAAALLVTAPAIAQAATMQAVFTATVDYFSDTALNFGGQTAEIGDEIKVSFLYDPDLAAEGWKYGDWWYTAAYGGSIYDEYGYYDYPVPSPVISATVKVGTASYSIGAEYYGRVQFMGFLDDNGAYSTSIEFDAREHVNSDLRVGSSFASVMPSPLLNPTLEGSYSFAFPESTVGSNGYFGLQDRVETEGVITELYFTLTHAEITPYDDTPQPAPVPLPAGAPLVLTGLAGLIGLKRLKRRS